MIRSDRHYVPRDARIEPDSSEKRLLPLDGLVLAEALDSIYEGGGYISAREGVALLEVMADPSQRLTESFVRSLGLYETFGPEPREAYDRVVDAIGLPSIEENLEVQSVDPLSMQYMVLAQQGQIEFNVGEPEKPKQGAPLNNEFVLHVVSPYTLDGAPSVDPISYLAGGTLPAAIRMRALFPGLAAELHDYAVTGSGRPMGMKDFYDGLIVTEEAAGEDAAAESRRLLVLFTIADSILQRLVRPADAEYQEMLANAALASAYDGKEFAVPSYGAAITKLDNGAHAVTTAYGMLAR